MTDTPATPRPLTREIRTELGLPAVAPSAYRWAFAAIVVLTASVPLLLAKLWTLLALVVLLGFVVLPLVRWFEAREAGWREEVYRMGIETDGRVLDVEPASPGRADHVVRVEFRAGAEMVGASVIGCPLARRGLMPEDDVVVLYAAERPTRCLVVRKVGRPVVDAIFDD
jgi:hypothetical protein